MKKPTIYEIKRATLKTAPYFFNTKTLKFWGQTMKSFSVWKTDDPNKFLIEAPTRQKGYFTRRIFNTITKELETL